jgi:hypothetical protein
MACTKPVAPCFHILLSTGSAEEPIFRMLAGVALHHHWCPTDRAGERDRPGSDFARVGRAALPGASGAIDLIDFRGMLAGLVIQISLVHERANPWVV